jgi:two-component system response regulator NreC
MIVESSEENVSVVIFTYARIPLDGTTTCLNATDEISVVAGSTSKEDAHRYLRGHKPDVYLKMPPPSVPEIASDVTDAVKFLAEESPDTQLVVVSYSNNPEAARLALRAGAHGYVMITEGMAILAEAVKSAARGEVYVNPRLLTDVAMLGDGYLDGLTPREREVLGLLALGYSNAEAAAAMFLSTRTIESYRASLYEKLGIQTRREVVEYAMQHDLMPSGVSSD